MPDPSASELLAALGDAIGIPALKPDAQGCCRLLFDGSRIVELQCAPAQGRWLISCALGSAPVDVAGLRLLMQANHLGAGYGGGWSSVDARGHGVLHFSVGFADASAQAFLVLVEQLLDHAQRWEGRLAQGAMPMPFQRMADWAQRI